MRIKSQYTYSLIIPTRERPESLLRCVRSFMTNADRPGNVEPIILADHDDTVPDLREFGAKVIYQTRSTQQNLHYQCYGAQCATGRYIWVLNDDVEMMTENWDIVLREAIADFSPGKLLYVEVDDDTHRKTHQQKDMGCCFPILSVEVCDIMNASIPGEVDMWGGDMELWRIFPPSRVLHMRETIKLRHWSQHNHRAEADATAKIVEQVSKKMELTQAERVRYRKLLEPHV